MRKQKVRILLAGFDHTVVDRSAVEIVHTLKRVGADVSGPVPFPKRIERFTVNRSPHVNKKSREQFEIRTCKRLITIITPTPDTVAALDKIELPSGVEVKIKLVGAE